MFDAFASSAANVNGPIVGTLVFRLDIIYFSIDLCFFFFSYNSWSFCRFQKLSDLLLCTVPFGINVLLVGDTLPSGVSIDLSVWGWSFWCGNDANRSGNGSTLHVGRITQTTSLVHNSMSIEVNNHSNAHSMQGHWLNERSALRWVLIEEKTNKIGKCNFIPGVDLPFRLVARGPKLQRQRIWRLNWMSVCESDRRTRLPPKGMNRKKKTCQRNQWETETKFSQSGLFFLRLIFFFFFFFAFRNANWRKWRNVKRIREKKFAYTRVFEFRSHNKWWKSDRNANLGLTKKENEGEKSTAKKAEKWIIEQHTRWWFCWVAMRMG